MYAVIETGGKQYRVAPGDKIKIEKLAVDEGASVTFDSVKMIAEGEIIQIGTPNLVGAQVAATVLAQGRGKKIRIVKHRRRKHYHKEQGHRQSFTEVQITDIQQ